jgi:hypothetical protein
MTFATSTLVDHQSAGGATVIQVRGALLVSSLQTLRELGFYERYIALLPTERHEPILFTLASSWISTDLIMAHYAACDAMALTDTELASMGEHVVQRIMGTFLGTIMRGSKLVGANLRPVAILQNYHRLWDRLLIGGSCTVRQTGPKDASIESRGVPMFRYRYFRLAYANLIRGAGLIFQRKLFTRVERSSESALTLSLSWV